MDEQLLEQWASLVATSVINLAYGHDWTDREKALVSDYILEAAIDCAHGIGGDLLRRAVSASEQP